MTTPMLRPVLRSLSILLTIAPIALAAQSKDSGARGGSSLRTPAPGAAFVLEGGVEFGGDQIIELTFTDGSTQKLTTGQGGTIAAGLQYRFPAQPRLSVAGTVGYKFVTNASENADIGISRIPVEVVARWMLDERWWAGAGLTRHASVRVAGDGFFPDADLDASTGLTFEIGYKWIYATYTAMTYTDPSGQDFDASAIGFMARWVPRARR